MRAVGVLIALALLAACRGRHAAAPRSPAAAVAEHVNAPGDVDEPFCRGDTSAAHPDPTALVREFLARDTAGEFLAATPFYLGATDCAGEGTDAAAVVAAYSITVVGITPDTARYIVAYQWLGTLQESGAAFRPDVKIFRDTFVLIRRNYGWRITGLESLHDLPMLSVAAAKAHWLQTATDIALLDSAYRQSGAGVVPN